MTEKKRFQDCSWPIRMLRRLWYVTVPYYFLKLWLFKSTFSHELDDFQKGEFVRLEWWVAWKAAKGMAQGHMNWWYTWEEVKENLSRKHSISLSDDESETD